MGSVLCALTPALSPELLKFVQQGSRGTEEKGVLLGDGVVERRVIAMAVQPATENGTLLPGVVAKRVFPHGGHGTVVTATQNSRPCRAEVSVPGRDLPSMGLSVAAEQVSVQPGLRSWLV